MFKRTIAKLRMKISDDRTREVQRELRRGMSDTEFNVGDDNPYLSVGVISPEGMLRQINDGFTKLKKEIFNNDDDNTVSGVHLMSHKLTDEQIEKFVVLKREHRYYDLVVKINQKYKDSGNIESFNIWLDSYLKDATNKEDATVKNLQLYLKDNPKIYFNIIKKLNEEA